MIATAVRYLPRMRKAIGAGVTAGVLMWAKCQADGLTSDEVGQVAGAAVAAGAAAWTLKNR
ncbi:MAG: hypothetical protein AB7G37_03405 [Solirubrobacteraceae bacterium]